jgi:hypothetical protein
VHRTSHAVFGHKSAECHKNPGKYRRLKITHPALSHRILWEKKLAAGITRPPAEPAPGLQLRLIPITTGDELLGTYILLWQGK